jgi:membrane protease YdiL (CAAX protease family)
MSTTQAIPLPDNSTKTRWTWITVLLLCYHLLFFLPTLRHSFHAPQEPKYPVIVRTFVLLIQWLGFYIAWRGIRASRLTFADLFDKQRSPNRPTWEDCKDGFAIIFLTLGVNLALAHFQPFVRSNFLHSYTLLQYSMALLVALSAGITEEVTYRGFFLSQLRLLTHNLRLAIFLQAVLFALFHGLQQNLTLALSRFFYGILFAFFAIRRNSLWPAIVGHVMIDVLAVTIQYFKYR